MLQGLRGALLQLARSRLGGVLLRFGLTTMSFLIPAVRLRETPSLLAFNHPSPSYPVHIIIVPRKAYRTLLDIPPQDGDFLRDLLDTVQSLVREMGLETRGYRLIANGGSYQDVPVVHFHLISGGSTL